MNKPTYELPKRPIVGLGQVKEEPSGKRVWELIRRLFGAESPHSFFLEAGLFNLFPLAFFNRKDGRNIIPEEFAANNKKPFLSICAKYLLETLRVLGVQRIVCFGRFVEKVVKDLLSEVNLLQFECDFNL